MPMTAKKRKTKRKTKAAAGRKPARKTRKSKRKAKRKFRAQAAPAAISWRDGEGKDRGCPNWAYALVRCSRGHAPDETKKALPKVLAGQSPQVPAQGRRPILPPHRAQ